LYASPNIIKVIKSERMRGEGNAERVGDIKTAYKILFGKLKV
jgi:hypothetical protein